MELIEPHDVGTVIITMQTAAGTITHVYPKARATLETRYPDPQWNFSDTFSVPTLVGDDGIPCEVTLTLKPFKNEDGVYLTVHEHVKKEIPNE